MSLLSVTTESDAKHWLSLSELLLLGSAAVLVVGLLGEWSDSENWKKRVWYKLAKAAVVIGVVGELLGDAGIFDMSARLQVFSDVKLNEAAVRANEAAIRANNASISALRAHLALVKLLKPRNLSDEAQKRIIERIKPLGPQPFMFAVSLSMEEGSDLPRQLGVLLIKDCEWKMHEQPGAARYKGLTGIGVALGSGVVVSYDSKNEALKKAALALVEALGDEAIASDAEPQNPDNPADNPNVIQVAVGTKPMFFREIERELDLPRLPSPK
jgi:hypothetical protein